ncbi:MAG TPA: hypothetical protein VK697_05080, partial [Methylomirabilota bacterium]|nr:hypothetical protein [Methylomirabilota bacterium]
MLVANVADDGVAALVAGLADWSGRVVATALVDDPAQDLPKVARGISEQYATAGGPATALLGRITATTPSATQLEIHGLDPHGGTVPTRLALAGRHNA